MAEKAEAKTNTAKPEAIDTTPESNAKPKSVSEVIESIVPGEVSAVDEKKAARIRGFADEFGSTEAERKLIQDAFESGTEAEEIVARFVSTRVITKEQLVAPVGRRFVARVREVIG